jgi:hypothetical protein
MRKFTPIVLALAILSALALAAGLALPGCSWTSARTTIATALNNNKPAILAGETTGVAALTKKAFEQWALTKPETAQSAARSILAVLPTAQNAVAGQTIQVSDTVGALLNTQILAGLDPVVIATLTAGSGALNAYAKIPAANLTQDEKDYIGAALTGLANRLTNFLAEPPPETPPAIQGTATGNNAAK